MKMVVAGAVCVVSGGLVFHAAGSQQQGGAGQTALGLLLISVGLLLGAFGAARRG
jgi:hypothetical protein